MLEIALVFPHFGDAKTKSVLASVGVAQTVAVDLRERRECWIHLHRNGLAGGNKHALEAPKLLERHATRGCDQIAQLHYCPVLPLDNEVENAHGRSKTSRLAITRRRYMADSRSAAAARLSLLQRCYRRRVSASVRWVVSLPVC
eukprot:COSAG06_NODE_1167_length_10451_cov_16.691654_3_plen_144_part_00